jgi:RNA polymerase sigma-70 factor, ECF subfamily
MNRLYQQDSSLAKEKAETLLYRLLQDFEEPLFRFVLFKVSNREVALDIVQDTFTKVWQYICSGKKIEHEQAFLYRIARNAVIDHYKKAKSLSLDFILSEGHDVRDDSSQRKVEAESDYTYITNLLEHLDEESQTLIYMRYIEEVPIEEIARLFGKTKNAITVKIHRSLAKLKAMVE